MTIKELAVDDKICHKLGEDTASSTGGTLCVRIR